MSETFFAYGVHVDSGTTLRFFLHQANLQPLDRGTDEFFQMLAEDFAFEGLPRFEAASWCLRHFVSDYMLDERYGEWQDVWANHWDVEVKLAVPIDVTVDPTRAIGTRAYDTSQQHGPGIILPAACWIVADFPTVEAREDCIAVAVRDHQCEATRLSLANRTVFSLGEKDREWFERGQPGAEQIRGAIGGCGGTCTWRDLL